MDFKLLSLHELTSKYAFRIPSFQRGYRWEEQEVSALWNDLIDFSENSDSIYLLQPLVVHSANGEYRVLDGQQRLTTLRILLSLFGIEEIYTLVYDRDNTIDFCKLDELKWNLSPDSFYIYQACQTLRKKLNDLDPNKKEKLINILSGKETKKIQFIWYEPTAEKGTLDGSEEIAFFERFNKGRIPLTSSELIKALFILNTNKQEKNLDRDFLQAKNNLLITQWDQLEQYFQIDDFFQFIFPHTFYSNRMDALFDFVTNNKPSPSQPLCSYYYYQIKYKQTQSDEFSSLWDTDILAGFDTLLSWYENVEYYNYIGWLTFCGTSAHEIKKHLQGCTCEKQIRAKLYELIVAQFESQSLKDLMDITYDSSDEKDLRKILLLFNIQLYIKANTKFPFSEYYNRHWDLEHISSQHNSLTKDKDRANWIEYAKKALQYIVKISEEKQQENPEAVDLLKQLEEKTYTNFEDIYHAVGTYFDKEAEISEDNKHSIGNLVLLDEHTNRSYGNAPFPYKRACILGKDMRGEFVPLGTKNVFLHYYTAGDEEIVSNPLCWNEKDRKCYEQAIQTTLGEIFNKESVQKLESTSDLQQTSAEMIDTSIPEMFATNNTGNAPKSVQTKTRTFTFVNLLKEYKVQIPSIQREYAYGRPDEATKRTEFLAFLLPAFTERKRIHLDFIYGYAPQPGVLEPLDGQQRLTTLFLLYWLTTKHASELLLDSNKEPLFSYQTRPTADAFCKELSKQNSAVLLTEWKKIRKFKKDSSTIYADPTFGEFLRQQTWFWWSWRKDPTVNSMLTVLSDMALQLHPEKESFKIEETDLVNITFDLLDLDTLEIKEDLYVKMNARGKQLSEFDLKKSSLEAEIQAFPQKADILKDWQKKVDGLWLDYFWEKYIPTKPDYTEGNIVETHYLYFWNNIENLYQQLNPENKKVNSSIKKIYVDKIYQDMSALIYEKEGKTKDISELLTIDFFLPNDQKILFESMCEDKLPGFDVRAMFMGLLFFARKYASRLHEEEKDTCDNFNQYMRMVRNICLNDNRSIHIDDKDSLQQVSEVLEIILNDFEHSASAKFDKFLSEYSFSGKPNNGNKIDKATKECLEEEKEKAKLRCKSTNAENWNISINDAEKHSYLRGQLSCLLAWSKDDYGNISKAKFDQYFSYLTKLDCFFTKPDSISSLWLYSTLLSFKEYPTKLSTLYTLDQNRDYSWKRAMRDAEEKNAEILKQFIDKWQTDKSSPDITLRQIALEEPTNNYCKYLIQDTIKQQKINGWRKWILYRPQILSFSLFKKLLQDIDGHYYLLRKTTKYSTKREIFLLALADNLFPIGNQPWKVKFNNKDFEIKVRQRGKHKNRLYIDNCELTGNYNFEYIRKHLIEEGFPDPIQCDENILSFRFKAKTYYIQVRKCGKYTVSIKDTNDKELILTEQENGDYQLLEHPDTQNIDISASIIWDFLTKEGFPLSPYNYDF